MNQIPNDREEQTFWINNPILKIFLILRVQPSSNRHILISFPDLLPIVWEWLFHLIFSSLRNSCLHNLWLSKTGRQMVKHFFPDPQLQNDWQNPSAAVILLSDTIHLIFDWFPHLHPHCVRGLTPVTDCRLSRDMRERGRNKVEKNIFLSCCFTGSQVFGNRSETDREILFHSSWLES